MMHEHLVDSSIACKIYHEQLIRYGYARKMTSWPNKPKTSSAEAASQGLGFLATRRLDSVEVDLNCRAFAQIHPLFE